jgi:2-polyprenyl-6-methoxyphenol hydroxylase-like FAD-dependent oxidoreductase
MAGPQARPGYASVERLLIKRFYSSTATCNTGGKPHMTISRGGHAVVVGASIAGLLAARVLAEKFSSITIIEKGALPDGPKARRGVPQSKQPHRLHYRGVAALEELLPGISREMLDADGVNADSEQDIGDYLLRSGAPETMGIAVNRRLLEYFIRRRTAALPNVRIIESTRAKGLTAVATRVTGVRVRGPLPEAGESALAADLVVDAEGRGSRASASLGKFGYTEPATSEIRPGVVYVSPHHRREPRSLNGRVGCAIVPFPGQPRGSVVLRQEKERFVVLLFGAPAEDTATDNEGMLAFAESLCVPDVAGFIRSANPLDESAKMYFPVSLRRHYEKLDSYPDAFLVMGDALCSFDPVYGQGLTVAALEALALRSVLANDDDDLPRRFYKAATKIVDAAWEVSAGDDLRFPEIDELNG